MSYYTNVTSRYVRRPVMTTNICYYSIVFVCVFPILSGQCKADKRANIKYRQILSPIQMLGGRGGSYC